MSAALTHTSAAMVAVAAAVGCMRRLQRQARMPLTRTCSKACPTI